MTRHLATLRSLLKIHEKYEKYIFRIIFYVSLIKNDKQKKEMKLTFLNHLLALDNVFSTKSEEQEVNLVWPILFLIFDCPWSVYTAHDHDLFQTLSEWISVDIKIIGQVCLQGFRAEKNHIFRFCAFWGSLIEQRGFFSLNTNFVNSVATQSPYL